MTILAMAAHGQDARATSNPQCIHPITDRQGYRTDTPGGKGPYRRVHQYLVEISVSQFFITPRKENPPSIRIQQIGKFRLIQHTGPGLGAGESGNAGIVRLPLNECNSEYYTLNVFCHIMVLGT